MLFNSPVFLLLYLPITLILYWIVRGLGSKKGAVNVIILASLFFYGWWDVKYVALILGGILFNYWIVRQMFKKGEQHKKALMVIGVTANLGLLAYFKYADFLINNINETLHTSIPLLHIILPLGISFFIFQKIVFLIDAYRGEFDEINLQQFTAFVLFFPQLIAGPIPKHDELYVQFDEDKIPGFCWEKMTVGITAFAMGLFKKTVLADGIATYATPFFGAVKEGYVPNFVESWAGALCYTFQIYFDFSGYSDMAIGLALMMGYQLPVNFFSPYKATDIIDFWRRWHITLSRVLKNYLYIPLGGNRKGPGRQKLNLVLTMGIGGLWHGASWTFVIWGLLHALYLCVNHLWWEVRDLLGISKKSTLLGAWTGRMITFFFVILAWVFFRADNVQDAVLVSSTMLGINGLTLNPTHIDALGPIANWIGATAQHANFFYGKDQVLAITGLALITFFAPNTYQYLSAFNPAILTYEDKVDKGPIPEAISNKIRWKPSLIHGLAGCAFIGLATWYTIRGGEFLYFQF